MFKTSKEKEEEEGKEEKEWKFRDSGYFLASSGA